LAQEDPRVTEELVILAESLPVPENALILRDNVSIACITCHQQSADDFPASGVSPLRAFDLAARLREELLGLERTPEGREVLAALGADRFVETTDDDYAHLYQMIDELWLRPTQP
jgi:ABC-type phosphate/phosphonate transport system substrate-binding protein